VGWELDFLTTWITIDPRERLASILLSSNRKPTAYFTIDMNHEHLA